MSAQSQSDNQTQGQQEPTEKKQMRLASFILDPTFLTFSAGSSSHRGTHGITTLWRPRSRVPLQFANRLSPEQIASNQQVAKECVKLATSISDVKELQAEAIAHWNANYENCSPGIFRDEGVVRKMIITYEVINLVDSKLRDLNLAIFLGL